jgi:hypothetical protein
VVSHPYSDTTSDPPQKHSDQERFPSEKEQSSYRSEMEHDHPEGCDTDDWLRKRSVTPKISHVFFLVALFRSNLQEDFGTQTSAVCWQSLQAAFSDSPDRRSAQNDS